MTTRADLTGFEPATSGLTGRRALRAAPQVRDPETAPVYDVMILVGLRAAAEPVTPDRRDNGHVAYQAGLRSVPTEEPDASVPTRSGIFGAVALFPLLVAILAAEVYLAVYDTGADLHSLHHHATGVIWLGFYALLGIGGPVSAAIGGWHTRQEGRPWWQVVMRAEMAFLLIGMPATLLLLTLQT
jgi:hypothetical protein